MGLIKKRIKEKKNAKSPWFSETKKKVTAVALATGITFLSIFGMTSCDVLDNRAVETETTDTNAHTTTKSLREIVQSLNSIVTQLGIDNDEIKDRIADVEQKIASLEENGANDKAETIAEIAAMISDVSKEIESIKDRLAAVESSKDTSSKQIEDVESEIAKVNVRLAVEMAVNNSYVKMKFDSVTAISAPNGDVVAERGKFNDYAYFNKEADIAFCSDEGKESFVQGGVNVSPNLPLMMADYLTEEDFNINKEKSSKQLFVFTNDDGATISVSVESGAMTEMQINLGNQNISAERSFEGEFAEMLLACKSQLQSIGLFQALKKDLEESLDYKYKGVTAINEAEGENQEAVGVMSGKFAAAEVIDENGHKFYSLQNKSNQYSYELDANGDVTLAEEYNAPSIDMTESFKQSVTSWIPHSENNTISKDEETGTYTIFSDGESGGIKVEITFNDDLSVDMKCYDVGLNMIITYKIEKITKAQFDETYNRINNIIESAFQQNEPTNNQ